MKSVKLCTAGIAVALSVSMAVPAWAGAVAAGIDLTNTESSLLGPTAGDTASATDATNAADGTKWTADTTNLCMEAGNGTVGIGRQCCGD